jgi:hypothetical protein
VAELVAEKDSRDSIGRIGDTVGQWGTPVVAAGRSGLAGLVARPPGVLGNGAGNSVEDNTVAGTAVGFASHPTSVANSCQDKDWNKATPPRADSGLSSHKIHFNWEKSSLYYPAVL